MKPVLKIFTATTIIMCIICFFVFWHSDANIEYVSVEGYVHDKETGKPIKNCTVAIFNCIIQKDNSYGRDKILYTETGDDGYYEIEIEKSHLMYIRAYKKGYSISRSGAVQSKRETEQNFILEKGNDTERDLYKQNEVEENIH